MTDLHIGHSGRQRFTLPADVHSQTVAVLGIRGSGKSHTATVIAEELLEAGRQVVIIDPTDVWWGLKSSRDGKKAGYPIMLLGGPHGDLPLSESDGAVIADFVVEQRACVVISLRHLRKAAQRRFVVDFAEQLYHRKGEVAHRTSMMLVIDECDLFVPQKFTGEVARCVGAIEDIVRRGRAAGIGVGLISQRAACVNKDVLTQLELMVAHRHTSPQDRKALQQWVQAHDVHDREDEFMKAQASLPRGEAYFWSPGWLDVFQRVAVRERRTFDSSATPKAGKVAAAPKAVAEIDLESLKERLADTIREREENDPRKLRARIAELELRREASSDPVVDQAEIDRQLAASLQWLREDVTIRLADVGDAYLLKMREGFERIIFEAFAEGLAHHENRPAGMSILTEPVEREPVPTVETRSVQPPAWKPAKKAQSDGSLGKCERAILTVLAQYPNGRSHTQTAILAGYSHTSGGYKNALSALRTAGRIDGRGDNMRITSQGRTDLGPVEPLPRGRALVDYWCNRLGKCEREIVRELVRIYPKATDHATLANRTGYQPTSGGFKNALSKLRTLELITRGSEIRASESFFA